MLLHHLQIQSLIKDPEETSKFVLQLDCCIAKYTKGNNRSGDESKDEIFYKLCETVLK